jgi:hypothetical protein
MESGGTAAARRTAHIKLWAFQPRRAPWQSGHSLCEHRTLDTHQAGYPPEGT